MRTALLFFLGAWMVSSLWADDLTRTIQQRLKDQGFYYGEVDGQGGEETSAAIRRYQIRHGLKVTGQLNEETLHTLGMKTNGGAGPAPGYQENGNSPGDQPGNQYYRQGPRPYDDRPFAQSPPPEYPEEFNQAPPPQFKSPGVITSLPRLFSGTIYERAPAQVQENVLYAIQGELMRMGLFRATIDGQPGPATTDAIVRMQQYQGLVVSGRLDNETLNALRAFPGQRNGPPQQNFQQAPGGERFDLDFSEPF